MGYILLLIGAFGVPYALLSFRNKKNETKKNIALALLCTVVLLIGVYEVFYSKQDNDNAVEESTLEVSNNGQVSTEFSEADIKTALEIDSTITEHIKHLEKLELETNDIISSYADGKINGYTAYESVREAKNQYSAASISVNRILIPENISYELRSDLEKIKSGVATNYYTRSKAMEHFMNYIDNQKISDLDKMKQELEISRDVVRELNLNTGLFYSKVGIPEDPQQ
ncbi:hypothetical protein C162_20531 [Paenibacillus sp. FSL R7-269]|uniref:hypothetical protein n=1 Tax=Paenibacillus sp. FSL R7-269 TaxID=1226755 RepID=UPI0003E1E8E0|nr:hypothetical protein [Paenibacillus sp. FSL R7-269]ETT45497.1 hypothetical protein C162_20531 [Paenibacillus sp. FSL R7-269]